MLYDGALYSRFIFPPFSALDETKLYTIHSFIFTALATDFKHPYHTYHPQLFRLFTTVTVTYTYTVTLTVMFRDVMHKL